MKVTNNKILLRIYNIDFRPLSDKTIIAVSTISVK